MEITTRNKNSAVAVLDLHGQLTLTSDSETLDRTIQELLQLRATRILLNISDVKLLDCSGVGHLLHARERIVRSGGTLAISGLTHRVQHIFNLFKLGQVFETFETDDAAIASFFRLPSVPDSPSVKQPDNTANSAPYRNCSPLQSNWNSARIARRWIPAFK